MIGRLSSCPTFTLLSLIVLFLQASTDLLLPDEPQLKMYNDRERMLPRFDSLANKLFVEIITGSFTAAESIYWNAYILFLCPLDIGGSLF